MGPRRSKHRDGRPNQGNEIARKDGLQPRVDMARDPFTIHATLNPLNCPMAKKAICKVAKVRVAGTIYDVPGIVGRDRQQTLAIRWIPAFKRRINYRISLDKCAFDEILDAYRKRGIARKKRENLHGLASANRSLAHFRWW